MTVSLQRSTDLWICSDAIRECHDTKDKSDKDLEITTSVEDENYYHVVAGDKDKALIDRVGNKHKHGSTLEHLVYTFAISGISRALLQELARHRIASLTVKSTRYTLSELAKEPDVFMKVSCGGFDTDFDEIVVDKFLVMTDDEDINMASIKALAEIQRLKKAGKPNDKLKFCLPESYKTSLTWTINARSLQNFINLRSNKSALWEIRILANKIFEALPKDHKYLFEHFNQFEMIENMENAEF